MFLLRYAHSRSQFFKFGSYRGRHSLYSYCVRYLQSTIQCVQSELGTLALQVNDSLYEYCTVQELSVAR